MATHKKYRNKDGEIVPATTTICSRFGESGGLMYWANQVGLGEVGCDDQERCAQCGRREGKEHYQVSKQAADVGTFAHDLIDDEVTGAKLVNMANYEHLTDMQHEQAENCLTSFRRWREGNGVEFLETELPLVSERYQFGGRIDSVGRNKCGALILPDWKTSNGIYVDQLCQLGAYTILLDEYEDTLFGEVEEVHILRISKDIAAFEHRSWTKTAFQPAIDMFKQLREAFGTDKAVKKLLK